LACVVDSFLLISLFHDHPGAPRAGHRLRARLARPGGAGLRATIRHAGEPAPGPSARAVRPAAAPRRADRGPHAPRDQAPPRPPPWGTRTAGHEACERPRVAAARPLPGGRWSAPDPGRGIGPEVPTRLAEPSFVVAAGRDQDDDVEQAGAVPGIRSCRTGDAARGDRYICSKTLNALP
jgi:hypothetical protein